MTSDLTPSLSVPLPVPLSASLSTWLAATDIGYLELRGPDVHLCLHNDAGQVTAVAPGWWRAATGAVVTVAAATVGVFLHHHPAQAAPLARPGQAVAAAQVIGLLRIGALLLPIVAPQDGVMAAHCVAHGTAVGHGTPLIDLISHPLA